MADLRVQLCGVPLANPLIASSGPLCYAAKGIRRVLRAGAAAAVTKTIAPTPAENPVPHILAVGRGNMLNSEKWADLSVEQWTEQEFPLLRDSDGVVIASLGHNPAAVAALAPLVAKTNAVGLLEITSYFAEDMVPMVKAVKSVTDLPVLIKACADWADLYGVVDACIDAGADGVTAGDAFGPVLHLDIETARPVMGGSYGHARLSGSAIKLLWVRIVADLRLRHPDLPIVATGGVTDAEDVVEMLMAGATAVAACTAPMLKGVEWFSRTSAGLDGWLDRHGYTSVAAVRGAALPSLVPGEDKRPLSFSFDAQLCNECGLCVRVCAYEARGMSGREMSLDSAACRFCGLCVSVCPTHALLGVQA